ncbi:MAG: DsbA family oxidoreductase, partial [Candidatus Dormibacteraeota bacterium]|nr:DsbA family oxidoreductase [Candidatus Dormibacteraeota bacterium]
MKVEVWSDVVCPWCYLGKRRLERALERFEHRDQAEVAWRSFELDPAAPRVREEDNTTRMAAKYGLSREEAAKRYEDLTQLAAQDGLTYHLESARSGNTFDAHRILQLAADRGLQDAVKERFFAAYFTDGEAIGDPETLVRLAGEAGIAPDEVRTALDGDAFAEAVRADEREAGTLGISGVPFFVFERKYAVSGAQSADLLLEALRT